MFNGLRHKIAKWISPELYKPPILSAPPEEERPRPPIFLEDFFLPPQRIKRGVIWLKGDWIVASLLEQDGFYDALSEEEHHDQG